MPEVACRNCDTPLAAGQKFCGACGQRVVTSRLTMREIGHDFLHAITHVDHSILSLVRALLTRPGRVARDFIEGRRKRYFGPFAFLVISVGLASFIILVTGIQWFRPITDSGAAGILQRHINLVSLLQVPLLALCLRLLFWGDRLYFGEHLVLAAYTSGLRVLFLALVESPLMYFTHWDSSHPIVVFGYYGLWFAYFAFAATQFYRGNRIGVAARALLATLSSQAMILYLVFLFIVMFSRFQH